MIVAGQTALLGTIAVTAAAAATAAAGRQAAWKAAHMCAAMDRFMLPAPGESAE